MTAAPNPRVRLPRVAGRDRQDPEVRVDALLNTYEFEVVG